MVTTDQPETPITFENALKLLGLIIIMLGIVLTVAYLTLTADTMTPESMVGGVSLAAILGWLAVADYMKVFMPVPVRESKIPPLIANYSGKLPDVVQQTMDLFKKQPIPIHRQKVG